MTFRALTVVALLLFAVSGNSARADGLETSGEKALGRIASRALMDASGVDTDPLLEDWVKRVGARVAANSPRKD
ncbi:MAG: hypothetical protein V4671_12900, partial [Armatimonadota bacterium]